MTDDTLLADTLALIAEHAGLPRDAIGPDTELEELDIHSLELTEIIMELEERYDVAIDLNTVDAWESFKTIGDVVAAVRAETARKGAERSGAAE